MPAKRNESERKLSLSESAMDEPAVWNNEVFKYLQVGTYPIILSA